jgi:anti-anti-sigma regulatory factor
MSIENLKDTIILSTPSNELGLKKELDELLEMIIDKRNCDVVIDFIYVNIIGKEILHKLFKLLLQMTDYGHRLVFCSIGGGIMLMLKLTGLDRFFEFGENKLTALASLQTVN